MTLFIDQQKVIKLFIYLKCGRSVQMLSHSSFLTIRESSLSLFLQFLFIFPFPISAISATIIQGNFLDMNPISAHVCIWNRDSVIQSRYSRNDRYRILYDGK